MSSKSLPNMSTNDSDKEAPPNVDFAPSIDDVNNKMDEDDAESDAESQGQANDASVHSGDEISIDDVGLPVACINRVFKDSVQPGINLQKEARRALNHSTVTFINYLLAIASEITAKAKKKIVSANDIIAAIQCIEMGDMVNELREFLEEYQSQKRKAADLRVNARSYVGFVLDTNLPKTGYSESQYPTVHTEEDINIMDIDEDEENIPMANLLKQ